MANRTMLICLLGLGVAVAAIAQDPPSGATNKTVITSDKLSFDYKRYVAVFDGNVVVNDPKIHIESDQLTVIFNTTNDVKSVTAVGKVRLCSEDKVATCNKAVYMADTEQVFLTGNAVLTRGKDMVKDTVTGEEITFFLHEEKVVVAKRATLVFYTPSESTNAPVKTNMPIKLPTKRSGNN